MTTDDLILSTALIIEIVNLCLLIGLISVYWKNYKMVKNKFSAGLLFFSSTFLLKSILFIVAISVFLLLGGFGIIHEPPDGRSPMNGLMLLNGLECIALAFLFKITWE